MTPSSFIALSPASSSTGAARHTTSSYLLLSSIAIISAVAVGWWVQCKTSFQKEISDGTCNDDPDETYSPRERFRAATDNKGVDTSVPAASYISNESKLVMRSQKSQREQYKERRRLQNLKQFAMKKTMYDNISMLCPEGERLCTISKKKASWYVGKGLARWIENHTDDNVDGNGDFPRVIQLLFEPKCRSSRGSLGSYINAEKINQCVVCGETSNYMRHYIVPYAYRTLLPIQFKSHLSHDIVILCGNCNHKCERQKQIRMNDMEETVRINRRRRAGKSYNEEEERAVLVDTHLYQVRSYAMALHKWKGQLPKETISKYETTVKEYLIMKDQSMGNGKDNSCVNDAASSEGTSNTLSTVILTETLLQQAVDIPYCMDNPNYIPGPQLVIQDLNQDDTKIQDFIKDWRRHFLRVAKPRFLPVGWSVHSPVCYE